MHDVAFRVPSTTNFESSTGSRELRVGGPSNSTRLKMISASNSAEIRTELRSSRRWISRTFAARHRPLRLSNAHKRLRSSAQFAERTKEHCSTHFESQLTPSRMCYVGSITTRSAQRYITCPNVSDR